MRSGGSAAMAEHNWFDPILGAASAVGVGVLTLLGVKITAKPAQDKVVVDGFAELLEATRAALTDTRTALEDTRAELVRARTQRDEFQALLEEERASRAALDGELRQLRAIIDGLERLLRRNNIPVPVRKQYGAPLPEIVETTPHQDEVPSIDG